MSRLQNQLPQVAFAILLALSLKPRHGYEIMQQIEADSDGRIRLGPGALYTSIKQLFDQGLIEETNNSQDTRRRYYQLAASGRKRLQVEMAYYQRTIELARKRQILATNYA